MLRDILLVGLALLVLALFVVGGAVFWLDHSINGEVEALRSAAQPQNRSVSESDLAGLPTPVQRYLRASGVVGQAIPSIVRLTQRGRIRSSETADWMQFEAEQTYTTNPPGFVWRAWFTSRAFPVVMGRDKYDGSGGSIFMRMGGLLPVADESGEELRAAALLRYLNEMMWFPAAYLGENVTWRAIDDNSAEVSISDNGVAVSGVWFFGSDGLPVNFEAQRYNTATHSVETWQTPLSAHATFDGQILPQAGSALWQLPHGQFGYIELQIDSVTYDGVN